MKTMHRFALSAVTAAMQLRPGWLWKHVEQK